MGQALLVPAGKTLGILTTNGCGPCIGVAVAYESPDASKALLAHLPPETNVTDFSKNIRAAFDDDFNAKMTVHMTTVKSSDPNEAYRQHRMISELSNTLKSEYDFLDLDDQDFLVSEESPTLSISTDTLKVSHGPGSATFAKADLDYMQNHMQQDATSVRYFKG
ncbi:hypothetical protein ACV22V_30285 [Burkholderia sp. AW33-5]